MIFHVIYITYSVEIKVYIHENENVFYITYNFDINFWYYILKKMFYIILFHIYIFSIF